MPFSMALLGATLSLAGPLDVSLFLGDLIELERLTVVESPRVRMISTWDPSGANADGFRPEWVKDSIYTIANLRGPGVVRRFYSARPAGQLRIFVDDATTPLIDMPCARFFSGRQEPFLQPLAGPMGGGFYSFFPIPYRKSLRMEVAAQSPESEESFGAYYQVTYQAFPQVSDIISLRLPLPPLAREKWEQVLNLWKKPGAPPPNSGGKQQEVIRITRIPPGEVGILAELDGAGIIDEIHLKLSSGDPELLRRSLLEMRWDNAEQSSVHAPVGDFFGNGFSQVLYGSLAMGLAERGYYSYLPMPFAANALIRLANESRLHALSVESRIVYRRRASLPDNMGRFHAKWRRQEMAAVELQERNLTGGHNYTILEATGPGRYIGLNLNVYSRHLLWWGEGDPMIFVNEDRWPPSIHGTGTEEFFNDAWGFHTSLSPVSGVLLAGLSSPGRCFGPNAVFSFHFPDSVPFQQIRVTIEHGTENNLTNDYSSTAYWYALPGAWDFFVPRPVHERIAPLPDSWERLRSERVDEFLPELRQQVKEIASALARFPTDTHRHPRRVRVLRLVFQLADRLQIEPAEVKRLQAMMNAARKRPLESRFPVFDQIFLELARIL
jgi:hypothetical protein